MYDIVKYGCRLLCDEPPPELVESNELQSIIPPVTVQSVAGWEVIDRLVLVAATELVPLYAVPPDAVYMVLVLFGLL